MQSYDENDRIVDTQMLGLEPDKRMLDVADLAAKIDQAQQKGAVRHVIANMPNEGQTVEINGLQFRVHYVNNHKGDVHLKLINGGQDVPPVSR